MRKSLRLISEAPNAGYRVGRKKCELQKSHIIKASSTNSPFLEYRIPEYSFLRNSELELGQITTHMAQKTILRGLEVRACVARKSNTERAVRHAGDGTGVLYITGCCPICL